jgi:PTH1 family peptidyl-tRNA hydrolase
MESFLKKKLIVGLGNPTRRYKKTRHNVGFMVLDYLAKLNRIKFRKDKSTKAMTCKTLINSKLVILAKPMTYMNLSGEAVVLLKKNFAIKQEDILIIQDDIDLELGKLRIKKNSSSGGHKGIASIISSLNSNKFCRLKIGIGRPKIII